MGRPVCKHCGEPIRRHWWTLWLWSHGTGFWDAFQTCGATWEPRTWYGKSRAAPGRDEP
jgi:hypothetical protein